MEGQNQNSQKKYNRNRSYYRKPVKDPSGTTSTSEDITKILSQTIVISDLKTAEGVIQQLVAKSAPIAVDFEGVNVGKNGIITLVQIADYHGTAYLFDVESEKKMMEGGDSSVLGKLLSSDKILKVVHDCRNDSVNLLIQFGVNLRNVFDSQLAHKIIELREKKYERSVYQIGLNPLCKMYGNGTGNPLKVNMKKIYMRNQNYWQTRPMDDKMKAYAAYDVLSLMPCVYETLNSKILESERHKFNLFCNEHLLWYTIPSDPNRFKKASVARDKATFLEKCEASGTFELSNTEMIIYESLSKVDKERANLSPEMLKQLENWKREKSINDKIGEGAKGGVAVKNRAVTVKIC